MGFGRDPLGARGLGIANPGALPKFMCSGSPEKVLLGAEMPVIFA